MALVVAVAEVAAVAAVVAVSHSGGCGSSRCSSSQTRGFIRFKVSLNKTSE